ncbi:MAG: hypothetical protein Q8N81_06060 [bacterium]|nr:hypothetical protein [bacterium]
MSKKGFTLILLVFFIALILASGAGVWYYLGKVKVNIQTLPSTEDFTVSVIQTESFSVSPDNKWVVYADLYSGNPVGLIFYRLADNKKFAIRGTDIVEAAKQIPTVNTEYLNNTVTAKGDFQFFNLISNWTPDSKKFYADLGSGIYFKTGSSSTSYQFPVVVMGNNSTPIVTFEEIDSGTHEDWPNRVQQMKNLTCADCSVRAAFTDRYQKIQAKLPSDLRNILQYDWRKQPIISYRNNRKLAISSAGKAYYAKSKDNGVDLVELDVVANSEKVIDHFYLDDPLNRKTYLTDLMLSPDDEKIAIGLCNINFGGYCQAYVVENLNKNHPITHLLGKNVYYDKFWDSTSYKLYFGCPGDTPGGGSEALCVYSSK